MRKILSRKDINASFHQIALFMKKKTILLLTFTQTNKNTDLTGACGSAKNT